jgi:SAM-dependent methyltransferase
MASPLAAPPPWNLVASAYSAEVVPQFEYFAREALRLAAAAPSSRVVDVACGPGTLTSLAASAGCTVDALDFSPNMVDELHARLADKPWASRVEACVGDGMALPFADASFDAGFSMFGLMFFPDRNKGFRELLRVLKPGAPAVVSSWVPLDRVIVLATAFSALNELLPPPPNTPPFKPPLASPDECAEEMGAAGFREVVVHEVTYHPPAVTVAELWPMMVRTTAPIVLRKIALRDRWPEIERAVLERLQAKLGTGPVSNAMPAYLTFGRR